MKKIKLILILIASLIITSCCSLPKEVNPVKALKQIDDGLYLLDYIGDYDFDNEDYEHSGFYAYHDEEGDYEITRDIDAWAEIPEYTS